MSETSKAAALEEDQRNRMKRLCILVSFFAAAFVVWLALPKPPLLDGISFSQCVRDRNGKLLRITLSADQKFRIRTPLHEISPALIDATVRYEDKYYQHHPGINPVALLRATLNLRPGHAHNGASTITMQLARLRYHLRTRTVGGKFVQIVRALELERHYSKAEILEAYLNLAPYGRNIEGVGAASQIYFGKTAAHLTRPESISLSVIPQSPTRRALLVNRDNPSLNTALSRFGRRDAGPLHSQDARATLARDFRPRALGEHKLLAPHFVQQVLAAEKGRDEVVTTLDLARQQLIERRIADYVRTNRGRGIRNAAALLVDTRNMDVLAQVGLDISSTLRYKDRWTEHVRRAARFHAQTVRLRARPRAGVDSSIVDPVGCASPFRRLQSGKFRSRIRRPPPRQ